MKNIVIQVEENTDGSVQIKVYEEDKAECTQNESDTCEDIIDCINYYVYGDEMDETIENITKNMKEQNNDKSSM